MHDLEGRVRSALFNGWGLEHWEPRDFDPILGKPISRAIIMISAMTRLCLDAQAPPNSGGAAMMVGGAAMMVGGVQ